MVKLIKCKYKLQNRKNVCKMIIYGIINKKVTIQTYSNLRRCQTLKIQIAKNGRIA